MSHYHRERHRYYRDTTIYSISDIKQATIAYHISIVQSNNFTRGAYRKSMQELVEMYITRGFTYYNNPIYDAELYRFISASTNDIIFHYLASTMPQIFRV